MNSDFKYLFYGLYLFYKFVIIIILYIILHTYIKHLTTIMLIKQTTKFESVNSTIQYLDYEYRMDGLSRIRVYLLLHLEILVSSQDRLILNSIQKVCSPKYSNIIILNKILNYLLSYVIEL
jgi:hypothetical protein